MSQIKYYLANDALRDKIRMAGHRRVLAEHSLDARADTVLGFLNNM